MESVLSRTAYPTVADGEPFTIRWRTEDVKLACCQCLLTHRLDLSVKGPLVTVTIYRDNRVTALLRRHERQRKKA